MVAWHSIYNHARGVEACLKPAGRRSLHLRAGWAVVRALSLTLNPSSRFSSTAATAAAASTAAVEAGGVSVKKVTRSNFEAALEDLRPLVRESDFVALDLEMTGVTSTPWREAFEFDSSDVRYLKVKDSAEKFAVVQVGVCPFRWDGCKGSFVAHPHNFYIFPRRDPVIDGPAYEFLCQTTSLEFLAKHQFDFNACIHEGISYLSRVQEMDAIQRLSSKSDAELHRSFKAEDCVEIPITSTTDLLFTERMKNQFHEWRDGIMKYNCNDNRQDGRHVGLQQQFQTVFYKMRPAVMLYGLSSHQKFLIQMVIRKYFDDLVFVHVDNEETHVVYTESNEDKLLLQMDVGKDLYQKNESKVCSAVGFRHVFDLLVSEQKLIVGHNCFLDIAHIYSKFVGPLPSSIMEFARSVNEIFPNVIDTKHLLDSNATLQILMKKSRKSLSAAFSLLCPKISDLQSRSSSFSYVKVEVEVDQTESSRWNSGAKHEAGYDAFMTGCVFAQACSHMGIKYGLDSSPLDLARNDKLNGLLNLLYPSFNGGTLIDLSSGTERPNRNYKRRYPAAVYSNIVVLWGFSSELKPKNLKECLVKVFGAEAVASIFFLDATAALVQFGSEGLVGDFMALKDSFLERGDGGPLSVLHPLFAIFEGGETHACGYDVYREICGAPGSKVLFADQAAEAGVMRRTKIEYGRGKAEGASQFAPDGENVSVHHASCQDILDKLTAAQAISAKRATEVL